MSFFEDVADAVGGAVEDVADAVGGAVEDVADAVGDVVEDVADAVGDVVEDVVDLVEDTVEALGELAEDALEVVGDVYDAFAQLAEEAVEGAVDIVEDGWNVISGIAEEAWEAVEDAAEDIWEAIEDAAEDAWELIEDTVENLWEGVQNAIETAVEVAAEAAEFVADAAANAYEVVVDAIERTLTWLGELVKDILHAIAMLGACLAGVVIHKLAEGYNILYNFWLSPKRLSDTMTAEAAPVFPRVPLDEVCYLENCTLAANYFGGTRRAMTFSSVSFSGVTFPYMIFLAGTFDETSSEDRALMIHELAHVDQYRRFRFDEAFACAYGVGYADAGFSYRNNPLEAEAYAIQNAYVEAGA